MKVTRIIFLSTTAIALSSPVIAADTESYDASSKIRKDSNGNYSEKTKASSTDANGTTTSVEKKAKVDVDSSGNKDSSVTTTKVVDPAGLMNKSTVTTTDTSKAKDGDVSAKHEVKVDGKTVESTSYSTKP